MRTTLLLVCLVCSCTLALSAQECPGGRASGGDLGIHGLLCAGPAASCAVNVRSADDAGLTHTFAVEPVITAVAGQNHGVEAGDTLVAIDGMLITTSAGGQRLARLPAGARVRLLVRRGGAIREIRLIAARGCGIRSLRVTR